MLPESNDTPYTQCEFEPWQRSGDAFVVDSGVDLDFDNGTTLMREMFDSPDALTWAQFETNSWKSQDAGGLFALVPS